MSAWVPSSADLVDLVEGHLSKLATLRHQSQEALASAESELTKPLAVAKAQVLRVLNGVLARRITQQEARLWAFFVLRGYFPDASRAEPLKAIHVEIAENEQAIVDVLSRLAEAGDLIDGALDRGEIESLAATIGQVE